MPDPARTSPPVPPAPPPPPLPPPHSADEVARILAELEAGREPTPEDLAVVEAAEAETVMRAREDPNVFAEFIFGYRQAWFHREWQAAFSERPRTLIVSPRNHGKTGQVVARILWELGRNPNLRIKIVAQSDSMAVKRLFEIRDILDRDPRLKQVFPNLRPAAVGDWTKHCIVVDRTRFSRDSSIEAVGITSTATGGRADLLVFDDVVDLRNAIQMPQLREVVKQIFKSVWTNMLEPDGRAIYICTLWHVADLTHELLKNPEWFTIRYDVGTPEDKFAPIWPEWWPREALLKRHAEIGEREFARAFRNIALSDDESLVPRAILERCVDRVATVAMAKPEWPRYVGVDLAIGQRNTSAWTVVFTIAIDERGRRWVVDVRRGRFSSPETGRQIIDVTRMHLPNAVNVESNAYQMALQQWIHEIDASQVVPLQAFQTGANKADPGIGLPSLRVEWENGAWIIPVGGPNTHAPDCACGTCGWGHGAECECAVCAWLEEVVTYPIGQFTDSLMASWFAREAARVGGFPAASASLDVPRGRDAVLGHTRTGENPAPPVVVGGAPAPPVVAGQAAPASPPVPAPAGGALGLLGMPRAGGLFGAGMGAGGGLTLGAASIMGTAGVGGPGMFRRRSSVFDRATADSMAPVRMDERAEAGARLLADHGIVALAHVAPADWPATREKLVAEAQKALARGDAAAAQAMLEVVAAGKAKFGG